LHTSLLPEGAHSASRPVVLLVDDEPDVRIILRRLLAGTRPEYDILTATGVLDALGQIAGRTVALVVTDFNMPSLNGLQLTQAIKARAPAAKVALITAYTTTLLEQLARQCQVDYYLTKPFHLATVEAVVETALPRLAEGAN
jgi:CheY-like chemotaxis protein